MPKKFDMNEFNKGLRIGYNIWRFLLVIIQFIQGTCPSSRLCSGPFYYNTKNIVYK